MDISRMGKDLISNIDEALSTEYECYRMIVAFDKGNGAEGLAANEILKLIKTCRIQLASYFERLSDEDTYELLNKVYNIEKGCYMYGIGFNVSKDKLLFIRTLNELLSKYLRKQISDKKIDYRLILSEYLTIDMINILLSVLNKMMLNFDKSMQEQIIITKYHLAFCMSEVEESLVNNNYKVSDTSYVISETANALCGISENVNKQYIDKWAIETFYSALNGILNSDAKELNIVDVVNSGILRTILILVNDELASDLMHNAMMYLQNSKISRFNIDLIYDAITSRFEDENIKQVIKFKKD